MRIIALFHQFKDLLLGSSQSLLSKLSSGKGEVQEPENSLTELPQNIESQLSFTVGELPNNRVDIETTRNAVDEAFEKWLANPESADNSLLILSSPVTSVSRILIDNINDWAMEKNVPLRLLEWARRPENTEDIVRKLRQQLGRGIGGGVKRGKIVTNLEKPEIVVIPNLNWCYLRCFEGLEGIDYLQDVLLQDDSRFWVIASGLIGWEYLNCVSHFKAYCGKSIILPELDGEQLQTWLSPIVDKLQIKFDRFNKDFADFEKNKSSQLKYFERLSRVSEGVSSVALEIFLESICYEPIDSNTDLDDNSGTIQVKSPQTPNLPRLSPDDLYITYSLLLHGDLTLSEAAKTLGDEQNLVRSRIHRLRRKGIIEQKDRTLTVNPIHYPRLKNELKNNNFIIDEGDK